MRTTFAAASVLAAVAVAGCSASVEVGGTGFDRDKAERTIKDLVAEQIGAQVRAVDCPADVDVKTGNRIRCTVAGIDGSKGPVNVRFKNDDGDVRVSAPLLHVREAEQAISGQITAKLGGQTLVRCPEIIPVATGRTVRCRATKGGETRPVEVVLTDAAGHFRYRVLGT